MCYNEIVAKILGMIVLTAVFVLSPSLSWAQNVLGGRIVGIITPVMGEFVSRVLERAVQEKAQAVLFLLDTPGGLEESMRGIVRKILQSPAPVVVYVYPPGARAASAGSFIVLAAHHAFMSPNTTIGAAHPVTVEGQAVSEKIVNDAASFARSLATSRNRNPEIAEKMVRESLSLTEKEALEKGLIDGVCSSLEEVLEAFGASGASITWVEMGGKEKFLQFLVNPNLAYIFLVLGVLGLIFELSNPGAIVPGVFGSILLLLSLYAFSLLPTNWSGIVLLFLGFLFLVLDILVTPGIGVLTAGGALALLLGSVMVFAPQGAIRIPLGLIAAVVGSVVAFFVFALAMAFRVHRKKITTGLESMVGKTGVAREDFSLEGFVVVDGELWWARTQVPLRKGDKVVVLRKEGTTLIVDKKEG
ncbi:MAG: nodulation protein NfeD [Candidatus Caldatribacterium sp.]|nr:nodulation protein NfeD [Candidatus Caldatribacterium sp.]